MGKILMGLILSLWLIWRVASLYRGDFLSIVVCDVGQGDAILIRHRSTQVLIDGGKDSSVLSCLNNNLPFWDRTLELVVATHPHSDHINGLVSVLEHFEVKTLLTNGQINKTADFRRFKESATNETQEGALWQFAHQGMIYKLSKNIELSVLYSYQQEGEKISSSTQQSETELWDKNQASTGGEVNYNNGSIVLLLKYKQIDLLLMGDLEEPGERALLKSGVIKDIDILKVGHHGAKTSTIDEFLEVSRPEISLISVGKNNSYGHPHPQVIKKLEGVTTQILRTDTQGEIELTTDGIAIWRLERRFLLQKRELVIKSNHQR